jgi:precorrin-3B synthase
MKRGWCPSLYDPMESGDGLLVRIKPANATLTADAAMILANAASRHGNGAIDLTSRANLQFRGLTPASAAAFAETVADAGLADPDPAAERRRSIIVSPLAGIDPAVAPGTAALAHDIADMLTADETLHVLPSKFGIVIDGGGALPVSNAPGDIIVTLQNNEARLRLDGADLTAACAPADAVAAARRLIQAFLDLGPAPRMRALDPHAVFAAAGLAAVQKPRAEKTTIRSVGPLPGAFGLGLAFGQMTADTLTTLAGLSRRGDSTLRITPWRTILLPGVAPINSAPDGLITNPADPRLTITACAGKPACSSATVPTRADATRLAGAGITNVHVSGCTKGCAHPRPAPITLVGEAGRYNVVRHGTAQSTPQHRGLTVSAIARLLTADVA